MEAGASIVNIASLAAMMGGRGMVPYTASKHAVSENDQKPDYPTNVLTRIRLRLLASAGQQRKKRDHETFESTVFARKSSQAVNLSSRDTAMLDAYYIFSLSGFVDTVMLNKSSPEFHATEANLENFVPMKRMGKPEEIGTLIATLLGDDTTYVNGAVVTVDGGMAC